MSSPEQSAEPRLRWGFRAAITCAFLALVSAIFSPLVGALWATVFFVVAWGIRRRQVWAAIAGGTLLIVPAIVGAFRVGIDGELGIVLVVALLQIGVSVFLWRAAATLWNERSMHASAPWLALIALNLAASVCLHAYSNPTAGMENTLLVGDQILADNASWFLGRGPKDGDIIIFRYALDPSKSYIKRVAGIAGDRLRLHDRKLYRNGSVIDEAYAVYKNPGLDPHREFPPLSVSEFNTSAVELLQEMLTNNQQNGEIVVPDGKYFVLGDNRDNSLDSRFFGFVNRSDIIGSPLFIYASYDTNTTFDDPVIRSILNIRWKRILKPL